MKEIKIQTLHPESGKQNKAISLEKYEIIKSAILEILQNNSLTHTELMQAIHNLVNQTLKPGNWLKGIRQNHRFIVCINEKRSPRESC
jgi:hypothetical protein